MGTLHNFVGSLPLSPDQAKQYLVVVSPGALMGGLPDETPAPPYLVPLPQTFPPQFLARSRLWFLLSLVVCGGANAQHRNTKSVEALNK